MIEKTTESGALEVVYLADAEPHARGAAKSSADLRSCLILHALFSGSLIIGDSQSLNNPYFRRLVSLEEALPAGEVSVPRDIARLLQHGNLRIARRAGQTLRLIRDEHAARGVENVPDASYAELLETMTDTHAVFWDRAEVEGAFKAGVLERLEAVRSETPNPARLAVYEAASQWAEEQPVLLYKALRDWMSTYATSHTASFDLSAALRQIELQTSASYQRALPKALEAGVAKARQHSDIMPAARVRTVLEVNGLPGVLLDNHLLAKLPAEAFFGLAEEPARDALVGEFRKIRCGLPSDVDVLRSAAEEFAALMSEVFDAVFRGVGGTPWDRLQGRRRLMRLRLEEDLGSGRLAAALEANWEKTSARAALAYRVAGAPVPDEADGSPTETKAVDTRDRLVTAA
ncbi:hypothetical protein [Yinghuangia soli]|uniref:Uncharacterized protein n=1 Tax=Yinghuangia soli TaxID=2908204 RepID=A0AA41TZM7_9ACTN|nr:hypothetical protein [Yinghuangia soli]MCF2527671.1 hypothetical protein [Yinghuangia soli]